MFFKIVSNEEEAHSLSVRHIKKKKDRLQVCPMRGLFLFATLAIAGALSPTEKKLIVYHTSWARYGRNYQVEDLPLDHIADVAYAFF